jgi:hypothetical protein
MKIIAEMFSIFHSLPEFENTLKKKLYRFEKKIAIQLAK